MKKIMKAKLIVMMVSILAFSLSCSEFEKFELPEEGSIEDQTPPTAGFVATQAEGFDQEFRNYSFANTSLSATTFAWDFGDGQTSMEREPMITYPGEGTYSVSLTASDALGQTDTFVQDIVVVQPPAPAVLDPVIVNSIFERIAKLGSSNTCSCSGWDNDDIGEQGESSTASGLPVIKFDNNEPDHIYQEIEVTPNASYSMNMPIRFSSPSGSNTATSQLEILILAGTGYVSGYTPTYYATGPEFPSSGYGYTTVAQAEDPANALFSTVVVNPGNDDYNSYNFSFDVGANDSVAIFIRGIGGGTGGSYGYNGGNEEVRMEFIEITAIN